MKKLLILLLIALIFGTISADPIDEYREARYSCSKLKDFLKRYNKYEPVMDNLNKGDKQTARRQCQRLFPAWLCDEMVIIIMKKYIGIMNEC